MKKFLNKKGYTLIELLAVMIVMVSVGGIITSILVSALRGGNKTNVSTLVRQNGNYAIFQIARMIAFSRSFDGVSVDGTTYAENCVPVVPPDPTPTPTPPEYQYIKITSFDGGQTIFSCENNTIASNGASLIDSSTLTVTNCSFMCSQRTLSSPPSMDISFTLQRTTGGLFEAQSTIPFNTSVTLRNYNSN
jgi:type II secretory pathway pseudopilin PulG